MGYFGWIFAIGTITGIFAMPKEMKDGILRAFFVTASNDWVIFYCFD